MQEWKIEVSAMKKNMTDVKSERELIFIRLSGLEGGDSFTPVFRRKLFVVVSIPSSLLAGGRSSCFIQQL